MVRAKALSPRLPAAGFVCLSHCLYLSGAEGMVRDTKALVKWHVGFGGPGAEQHSPFAASFLVSSNVLRPWISVSSYGVAV